MKGDRKPLKLSTALSGGGGKETTLESGPWVGPLTLTGESHRGSLPYSSGNNVVRIGAFVYFTSFFVWLQQLVT